MTPRNTQHGASASARRTTAGAVVRAAPSLRAQNSRAQGRKAPERSPRAGKPARAKSDVSVAWRWWLMPLLVIGVAVVFVVTYYPVAKVQYRETREKVRLEAELKAIQARNQRLQASVDRLKTPQGVEDYARSQLGLVKAGDHVVVVVDGTKPAQPATLTAAAKLPKLDSEEAVVPPVGPWTQFLDSVFGTQ